jgi:nucleoside 2-deoxyribosyltransferase
MKVYLAAGFSRKNEIAEKSQELENLGIVVTSTWPWEDAAPDSKLSDCTENELQKLARKDLNEILRSDALILFTQSPEESFVRGGRMVETGFALGTGKNVLVCGPKENIFFYLPEIRQFNTWEELKATLTKAILV